MEAQNLYFIAVIPPLEIKDNVKIIQEDLGARFRTFKALKVIPHITLKAPFKIPKKSEQLAVQWFRSLSLRTLPFDIELNGFGCFPNPQKPVIYIKPIENPELLRLQAQVVQQFQIGFPEIPVMNLELHFHPHMTVAYRDLEPAQFEIAWKEFADKKFSATFEVDKFCLLQHNGNFWKVIDQYILRNSQQ